MKGIFDHQRHDFTQHFREFSERPTGDFSGGLAGPGIGILIAAFLFFLGIAFLASNAMAEEINESQLPLSQPMSAFHQSPNFNQGLMVFDRCVWGRWADTNPRTNWEKTRPRCVPVDALCTYQCSPKTKGGKLYPACYLECIETLSMKMKYKVATLKRQQEAIVKVQQDVADLRERMARIEAQFKAFDSGFDNRLRAILKNP